MRGELVGGKQVGSLTFAGAGSPLGHGEVYFYMERRVPDFKIK